MHLLEHVAIRLIIRDSGVVLCFVIVSDEVGLGGPQCACSEPMNRLTKGRSGAAPERAPRMSSAWERIRARP